MNNLSTGTIFDDAGQWAEWLKNEEAKTTGAYGQQPNFLIADWNRERDITRDYEGREILELLQNANDQAAEKGEQGRVYISLSEDGLLVANTGLPFSKEGVESLQTSSLSPKRRRRGQLIGNKGLGFRSILNWSMVPTIVSGCLRMAYSIEHTARKLEQLITQYPAVAAAVVAARADENELLLSLLRFPLFIDARDFPPLPTTTLRMLELSDSLISRGYATAIGMPFDSTLACARARQQLEELRPEVLLFAHNLEEICLDDGLGERKVWVRDGNVSAARVVENGKTLGEWTIYRRIDVPPDDPTARDKEAAEAFEIVVAVPKAQSARETPLYMYFPTEIELPLPVVCHATLELEQNRKHLQQKRLGNRYVLDQLAVFIAEIAESIACERGSDPWAGATILFPTGEYPKELEEEKFPATLIAQAKQRKILPTLGGKPVAADEALTVDRSDGHWLPARIVPECVTIQTEAQNRFISSLGVRPLTGEDLKARLNGIELDFEERIALIAELSCRHELHVARTAALLLDQSGRTVDTKMRVFMSPVTTELVAFPEWASLRFLHEPMRERLMELTGSKERGDLQRKLASFGVVEYSLANVVSALVAEANSARRLNPAKAKQYQAELLETLFGLYLREAARKTPVKLDNESVLLPNQVGTESPASSLYLGRGFGVSGEIQQALFERWGPQHLVDHQALPPIKADIDELRNFLLWLGASEWPREKEHHKFEPGFLDFVLRSIPYPVAVEDTIVRSLQDAANPELLRVKTVEYLPEILKGAPPDAIAAWLSADSRAPQWAINSSIHATLCIRPSWAHKSRTYRGPVPSLIRWILESTPWLKSSTNEPLRPKDCVLGEHVSEVLFPQPADPFAESVSRFGIPRSQFVEGWRRAGVLTSLAYLERDQIFAKLLELPQRSADGKLARPLYHWLLDASLSSDGPVGPNEAEFRVRGLMWGTRGDEQGFFPVEQLYHADSEGLPAALLKKLAIVSLRKRAGNDKVEQLFGVKPIEQSHIKKVRISSRLAHHSHAANERLQAAKPYLHKLRSSRTTQIQQLLDLKALQLELCWSLRVGMTFEGERYEYDVPPWEWLMEDSVLSIQVDPSNPNDVSPALLASSVGDALAALFRLADGGEFAQIYACREEDRLLLLKRLRSEAALEGFNSIKAEYDEQKLRHPMPATFPLVDSPSPSDADSGTSAPVVPSSLTSAPQVPPSTGEPDELIILKLEHTPIEMSQPRALSIRTKTPSERKPNASGQVTDGIFCERKVMEFEKADGRLPILVGHVMGKEGPLCDIISFASQESFDQFSVSQDLNLVERFIEVKGRNGATATIELAGNSLEGATRRCERYFLYRLFEASDGDFDLAILQNPLARNEAIRPAVHVQILAALTTKQYVITGGIRKPPPDATRVEKGPDEVRQEVALTHAVDS